MNGNPDPKPGRWVLPLVILGMVGVTYLVVNSIEPASPAQADSAATDTTSGPATTTTTLDERIAAYLEGLDAVDAEAQAMLEEATAINEDWDNRDETGVEFNETLAALQELVERAEAFRDSVQTQTPPSGFSELAEAHTILIEIADRVVTGAEAMVAGLRAPDTGQQRRAALEDFGEVIGEFDAQVDALRELAGAAPPSDDGNGEDEGEGDGDGEDG